ncbi:MAG: hypothetical protein R3C53_05750 [Pirellulaceae bacterium]
MELRSVFDWSSGFAPTVGSLGRLTDGEAVIVVDVAAFEAGVRDGNCGGGSSSVGGAVVSVCAGANCDAMDGRAVLVRPSPCGTDEIEVDGAGPSSSGRDGGLADGRSKDGVDTICVGTLTDFFSLTTVVLGAETRCESVRGVASGRAVAGSGAGELSVD